MANENVVVDPPVQEPAVPKDPVPEPDMVSVPESPAPTEPVNVPAPPADESAPPAPSPDPPPSFGEMFLASVTGITDAIDGLASSRSTKFNTSRAKTVAATAMEVANSKDMDADNGIDGAEGALDDALDLHVDFIREFQRSELS